MNITNNKALTFENLLLKENKIRKIIHRFSWILNWQSELLRCWRCCSVGDECRNTEGRNGSSWGRDWRTVDPPPWETEKQNIRSRWSELDSRGKLNSTGIDAREKWHLEPRSRLIVAESCDCRCRCRMSTSVSLPMSSSTWLRSLSSWRRFRCWASSMWMWSWCELNVICEEIRRRK